MKDKVIKQIGKYIRAVIFLVVIVLITSVVNYVMVRSGYVRYIIHEAGNSKTEDDYDCVVIGASHGRAAIDPVYLIESGYADNPINMCIQGATVIDNYYMLKEICRNNDIRKVILEMDYQFWVKDNKRDYDFGNLKVYQQLPMSKVKLEYVAKELLNKDFRTVIYKENAFAGNLSQVRKNLRIKASEAYQNYEISAAEGIETEGTYMGRGFFYREKDTDKKGDFHVRMWSEDRINSNVRKHFEMIVDYCKDNNIELVCITEPITPTSVEKGPVREADTYFANLCSSLGVTYIDYNLVKKEYLEVSDSDFSDWEGHMNGALAEKFSDLLGKTLAGLLDCDDVLKSGYGME